MVAINRAVSAFKVRWGGARDPLSSKRMAFKRPAPKPTGSSKKHAPKPGSKAGKHKAQKLSTEKFRSALDGTFENLRVQQAETKINSKPGKKQKTLKVVSRADIDAQVDQLAKLMK